MIELGVICTTQTGQIHKVQHKGNTFVLKKFSCARKHVKNNPIREIKLLQTLRKHPHPNVIDSVDECIADYWVLLPFAEHGDVFDFVHERGGLQAHDATVITSQVCRGLKHLKRHGWVHCDVSLENMLLYNLCPLRVKLCDFGLSSRINKLRWTHGKEAYMAPELFTQTRIQAKSSQDVFSTGVSIWAMLFNTLPFPAANTDAYKKLFEACEIHQRVLEWKLEKQKLSSRVYTLAIQMMSSSPLDRPPISRILRSLE